MEMAGGAADGAHSDDAGKQALVTLKDFEARFGPKLAAVPAKFGAEAAQAGYGGGLPRQILEAQAGKRGGVGEGGGQTERSEEHTSELQSHLNLVCRLLLE